MLGIRAIVHTYYGAYGPLVNYPGLAFLTAGLLVASFISDSGSTVYVYVVEEDCLEKEYQVDENGTVISTRILGPVSDCN